MLHFICTTCGVQYPRSKEVPPYCVICKEERQYVNPIGQTWTTLEEMQQKKVYTNEISQKEDGLFSITTKPKFAIGQNAYLVQSNGLHLLWDCITYLDQSTVEELQKLGGIQAIALSHPHYYSTQVEWAETFNAPIYVHEADKEWITRPSEHIVYWSGESHALTDQLTIQRLGGHFKGGSVLHWKDGNNGKGLLLTGDIIQVVADNSWVSFMYSYPNLIPLPANKVREMADRVKGLPFNRLYNAFHGIVAEHANETVQKSAERYIKALEGKLFET
ncbi:MBL fold metallo-hydrolase [Brevibacillus laterosporus]|nr:MBL fold metallo-hydrolase [Brevibacillus laterosporus]TPG88821.1 MBL fold metallo-hydrolase [Brevibacillus laterosporus]